MIHELRGVLAVLRNAIECRGRINQLVMFIYAQIKSRSLASLLCCVGHCLCINEEWLEVDVVVVGWLVGWWYYY